MKTIVTEHVGKSLDELVDEVIADAEPTLLATRNGQQAVLVPLDQYNAWRETLYLLSSPANAEHLRGSIAAAEADQRADPRCIPVTL